MSRGRYRATAVLGDGDDVGGMEGNTKKSKTEATQGNAINMNT